MAILNPVTVIEHNKLRLLIMDAPSPENIVEYIQIMKNNKVSDLVRTCELTYSTELVENSGIRCTELSFPDGDAPPQSVIETWLDIVDVARAKGTCVATHCVAGLGRAPVLVAVALIERGDMEPLDAIDFVRSRRRGAINRKQLQFLRTYRRRSKKKDACCTIM